MLPRASPDSCCDQDAGASPLVPPPHPDAPAAQTALRHLLGHDPHALGLEQSRWTLSALGQVCSWLEGYTPSGIWRVLDQLDLSWQRARSHIHSPDPHYDAKLAAIQEALDLAAASHGRIVTLYQDEVTIERQPSLAPAYSWAGHDQPQARRSHQANTLTRVSATLDPRDGRVVCHRASHLTVPTLVRYDQELVAAYPDTQLQLVQDNWPVHHHPDLLVALQPQQTPFPWSRPGNWPTEPSAVAIQRWGHLHQLADDLPALRAAVDGFLERFAHGSADLLRCVGLYVPSSFFNDHQPGLGTEPGVFNHGRRRGAAVISAPPHPGRPHATAPPPAAGAVSRLPPIIHRRTPQP